MQRWWSYCILSSFANETPAEARWVWRMTADDCNSTYCGPDAAAVLGVAFCCRR